MTVQQPPPQPQGAEEGGGESAEPGAGSGEESGSAEDSGASESREPEAEDAMACAADELQASLEPDNNREASGSRTMLRVTNVGGRMCQLRGYGGIQFLDYEGNPVDTALNRTEFNPPTITLQQSQSAGMDLTWDIYQEPCVEPETLQYTPPGDDESAQAVWGLGAVCRGGLVDATALRNIWGG
ncbi:DUF4232 domain-containing protein [Saccharopolyspora sp. HNM0983]|uniref:DUF4232 domain-containing protein n=1 Tax=Saccharopolyspora montiporae TaxID=2781240 RepID=A0A929B4V3_9PSEU|nr:DUF4232 domain-containing protein [Saccharopolyspora sp. HNM0983]